MNPHHAKKRVQEKITRSIVKNGRKPSMTTTIKSKTNITTTMIMKCKKNENKNGNINSFGSLYC